MSDIFSKISFHYFSKYFTLRQIIDLQLDLYFTFISLQYFFVSFSQNLTQNYFLFFVSTSNLKSICDFEKDDDMIQKGAIFIFESSFQQRYRLCHFELDIFFNSLVGIFSLIDTRHHLHSCLDQFYKPFKINCKNGKDECSLVSPIISLIEIINIITAIMLLLFCLNLRFLNDRRHNFKKKNKNFEY